MKSVEDKIKDILEDQLERVIVAIRASHPSAQDVKELKETVKYLVDDLREMKETLSEVLEQAKKTNGRVTALENWKTSFGAFISGGKSVWIFIATTIGIAWVVFGDILKTKLGLR